MQTSTVGIREAKIQLSKLLKLVQQGNEVILTDRGKPVGKIVPIAAEELPLSARLKQMEEKELLIMALKILIGVRIPNFS